MWRSRPGTSPGARLGWAALCSTVLLCSRLGSETCKVKLLEVFCSFQFSRWGLCAPPHLTRRGGAGADWQESEVWSEAAYPVPGPRPVQDIMAHQQVLLSHPDRDLVPARLGFALLVHKDVPAIINLLKHIYRPHHFYVIHVDRRLENSLILYYTIHNPTTPTGRKA